MTSDQTGQKVLQEYWRSAERWFTSTSAVITSVTLGESFAGVLPQCPALDHFSLDGNQIGDPGAESLAGVLGQYRALVQLDLCGNQIGDA